MNSNFFFQLKKGIECINNDFNLITASNDKHCSLKQYEEIYRTCRSRLFHNDCLVEEKQTQKEKNAIGCQFQLRMNQNHDMNRTITNQTALQNKHVYLYNIVSDYSDVDLSKNLSSINSNSTSIKFSKLIILELIFSSIVIFINIEFFCSI